MPYSIWISWKRHIISFQKAEGFEELHYPTHDEMLRFAVTKGLEGFGIQ